MGFADVIDSTVVDSTVVDFTVIDFTVVDESSTETYLSDKWAKRYDPSTYSQYNQNGVQNGGGPNGDGGPNNNENPNHYREPDNDRRTNGHEGYNNNHVEDRNPNSGSGSIQELPQDIRYHYERANLYLDVTDAVVDSNSNVVTEDTPEEIISYTRNLAAMIEPLNQHMQHIRDYTREHPGSPIEGEVNAMTERQENLQRELDDLY